MTTVREFDGIDDRVLFSIGDLSVVGGNVPVTIMVLVRLSTSESSWQTVVSYETEEGSERVGLQVFEDGGVLTLFDPFGFDQLTSPGFAPPDEWLLVGMHRPAGEDQQIRAHAYRLNSETWAHEDTTTRSDPGEVGASGRLQIGDMSDHGEFLAGRLAVVGVWLDTFSDQELEGAGLHAALRNWLDFGGGPASLLAFNQSTTADPVVDVVDSGVEQISLTGTTVVDDQDLDFDYSLGGSDTREARSWAAPAVSQADRAGSGTREVRSWSASAVSQADRVGSGTREVRSWSAPAASQADRAGSGMREARSWSAPAASQADRAGSGTREARSWSAPVASQAGRVGSGTREARSWSAPVASQAGRVGSRTREARSWAAPVASQADRVGSGTREARSWAAPAASWAEVTESGEPDRPITPFPFPPRPVTSPPFELQPVRSFKGVGRGCP